MKIYLINGESYLLINEKIYEIVKDSKNITTFNMQENSIEDILIEAGYVSLFMEEKFIIVKNANFFGSGKLKEDETSLLLNYLNNPDAHTTLIFITEEKIDMRKKITKLLKEQYSLITIPNLKPYEIENRVEDHLKKNGFEISKDSIKYIVQNCLNNYDVVMMEVEKLKLFYNETKNIKREDVTNIVSKSINTNNFLFVDALVDNNLENCLAILNDLKLMKVEPTVLLSLVARDFRIMLNIKTLLEQNKREYEIMHTLGLLDWQLTKYLNKVFPYKLKELEEIIIKISNLDLAIKKGQMDRFIGLELLILDICS